MREICMSGFLNFFICDEITSFIAPALCTTLISGPKGDKAER